MKKTATILVAILAACSIASAQKKPLDHSVYDGWQTVGNTVLSDDGRFMAYTVSPQQGDATLFIVNTETGSELKVERGGATSFSTDGKWAVFTIKAPYAATRQAKIDKKKGDDMPKDSLGYVWLEDLKLYKIADVSGSKTSLEKRAMIAYQTNWTKVVLDSVKTKPKAEKITVILNPATGHSDTLKNVDKYGFDKNGDRLTVVFKKDKKDSLSKDELVLFSLPEMTSTSIDEGKSFYSLPTFNDSGDKFVYLASTDTNATGDKHCSVGIYEELTIGKGKKAKTVTSTEELIPQDYTLSNGLRVNQNSAPFFSKKSSRVLLGVAECLPPHDTTLVDFETAQIDLWSYDIYMTPPMQKARASQLKTATYPSVINLAADRHGIIQLSDEITANVRYIDGAEGQNCLLLDEKQYQISSTWDSNNFCDVYLVNMDSGARTELFKKLNGTPSISPAGKYLTWYSYDDLGWHTYRLSDGQSINVTAAAGVSFHDEEDDHPDVPPTVDRPHWLEDDEAFIISDKFDIWKFQPDGKSFVNLTEGKGRENNWQLSYSNIEKTKVSSALSKAGVSQPIGKKETVYLTVFDRSTKENGIATISVEKPGFKTCFTDKFTFTNVTKARDADIIAFRKGNFNLSPDQHTTTDCFATAKKWSSINPQQAEYNWSNSRLVHWTTYDGTKLDGLLITPEDLDPTKKYPMMIYFYEKYSENLYSYFSPAPSASTVNLPFYASRGYVVFVPDIVYVDGHPGESAYNCICSGAEAMCEQFSFIDKDRMAIQGQSWGGYQTAYLVTRTDMFAAAGAGAPVGNMTSAYGGIRWESGLVRAMQYEHGQSRIGKSLWDEGGLELYIENSPIFHTQNVTTPVLIMHNDNDGAVPWYQGIEFFMSLRRFGHPAWLLEYNNEAHNLAERRNRKDLSIRLQQFFDHYLKGDPMPAWMKNGIPNTRKGEYFGFELTED
ncbi:MAG: prolyl oligopeptidase family serine peptidase [Bacteroidia bacterium]|nr:prolyl oligopeptidase family serine peptidase [Bacteroidia bacterium]